MPGLKLMTDIADKATRSRIMSGICGKNTKPEILIRKGLHALGFRCRLHSPKLPGKPDIVLPKYKAIILVNGCFWHSHNCYLFKWPSTIKEF
jgi:DNA mismatch endonuclease (patch repair protein)